MPEDRRMAGSCTTTRVRVSGHHRQISKGSSGAPSHQRLSAVSLKHREVQVRRVRRRVARCAHVAEMLAARHHRAFRETRRVSLEVRVVVDVRFGRIELVDS
jgi:hypothetical protein